MSFPGMSALIFSMLIIFEIVSIYIGDDLSPFITKFQICYLSKLILFNFKVGNQNYGVTWGLRKYAS